MLQIDELEVGYGESTVLRNIHLRVEQGQVVCLLGRNGVGKSTLIKSIMGLLRPKAGRIAFMDQDICRTSTDLRAKYGIGYVPQGREIFPHLTVEENLLIGQEAARHCKGRIPESIFQMFPVLKHMLHRKGGDLSGGQQQQLAIGRALISEPKLLLLDEPMEGIQPSIVMDIEHVIEDIKKNGHISVLLVEQSLEFAIRIADYFYIIDRGSIVHEGTSSELSKEKVQQYLTV